MTDNHYDLERFVTAQQNVYERALQEIQAGRKQSHWMWFVFPQIIGLGESETTMYYSIKSLDEAKAYLVHPVLGQRLNEISTAVLKLNGKSAHEIFGSPDDKKLRSSMTLFKHASINADNIFNAVLKKYYNAAEDKKTVTILQAK